MANFYDKFPVEVRDFGYDASDILFSGDTIQSVSAVPISTGITVVSSSFSNSLITVRVSGGIAGTVASIAVKATLVSGQLREAIMSVLIKPVPTT